MTTDTPGVFLFLALVGVSLAIHWWWQWRGDGLPHLWEHQRVHAPVRLALPG